MGADGFILGTQRPVRQGPSVCRDHSGAEGRKGMSNVVRLIALKMKETGADVHAIGDGGFAGCTSPENIHQLSVSIKGRPYTYFRMASTNI